MTTRPDVTGEMTVRTGDIRVLDIDWLLHPGDVNAADPRNAFTVMVTDAAGTQTGALAGEVTYAHVEGCGGESIWTAHLSD